MWNLFKSDVYRLLHSRFFFVLTLLYTLMTILLVSNRRCHRQQYFICIL